jgi:hypothetical protein
VGFSWWWELIIHDFSIREAVAYNVEGYLTFRPTLQLPSSELMSLRAVGLAEGFLLANSALHSFHNHRCENLKSYKVHRCFGDTFCLHPQGGRVGEASSKQICFALALLRFVGEDGGITLIRNEGELLSDYTASHLRGQYFLRGS